MSLSESEISNLRRKADRYKEVLQTTLNYRETWKSGLKQRISEQLKLIAEAGGIKFHIEERCEIGNLESIVLTLGSEASGLSEPVGDGLFRDLIKQNGSLVYQQLFNGKILVLINQPYIEKYGEPQLPKTVAVFRPEELKEPYILQHFETFLDDVIAWEDFDDAAVEPNKRIGFK